MASKEDPNKEDKEKSENKENDQFGGAGDVVTDFIEDVWQVMTPEMLERLRCVLTEDMGLSKQDADKFIQSQREVRKQRICLKKGQRIVRIGVRNQWIKELSRDIANQMASFIVGLLLSNRTPQTKKLTEKILERLCDITGEKTTVKKAKTRIQRSLVVIADCLATYFDEAISDYERERIQEYGFPTSIEDWEKESVITYKSSETYTLSEGDDYDFDKMSESELERLIAREGKKKVSIKEEGEFVSDQEEVVSDEQESDTKERSEEVETTEEESDEAGNQDEGEMGEEDEINEEEEVVEEEEEEEEEEKDESEVEEEEEVEEDEEDEEKVEEEEVDEEEEEAEEEEDESEEEGEGEGEEIGGEEEDDVKELLEEPTKEETEKPVRRHLDILELMKEDIESTPKGDSKTDRQMAVKEIIEKRFEEIAKDKLKKSIDSIVKFDIDETASIVANWLEKILPSGDIVKKISVIPSLIDKQGSAFEITTGDGSQYKIEKISSTTVAKKVADVKGINFPVRKKKLPRSMSPLNAKTTQDWADWALQAANVGEEWGKWLDKALDRVEEHLLKDKDTDSSQLKRRDDWKDWKGELEHEAQQWRAEKHKIKGEAYLWNKKLVGGNPAGAEKETKVVNF